MQEAPSPLIFLYETGKLFQQHFHEGQPFNSTGALLKALEIVERVDTVIVFLDEESERILDELLRAKSTGRVVIISSDPAKLASIAVQYPGFMTGFPETNYFTYLRRIISAKPSAKRQNGFGGLIGTTPAFVELVGQAIKAAASDATVLLLGESGTGKELFAKGIHTASPRSQKPFVAVNCAAIPKELMELEFFGSAKGAFTDSHKKREGYFVAANGGTLFLDEIGELPLSLQAKLLRVLQERQLTPVGSADEVAVNVRIVAATHRDLANSVTEGNFRQDLLYRLQVVTLEIPPLRERTDDIPALIDGLLARFSKKYNRGKIAVTEPVEFALEHFAWPGNVRQLENVLEQAVVMTDGNIISMESLPETFRNTIKKSKPFSLPRGFSLKKAQAVLEEYMINKALDETDGNRTHAAKLLEVSHRWLLYQLKK